MEKWKTLSVKPLLSCGRFLRVENHCVQFPDGRVVNKWPIVITPDYVVILAKTIRGTFVMLQQSKYLHQTPAYFPPGGYIEKKESPLRAAKRELLEETGFTAKKWIDLGCYQVDINRGCGRAHLYFAIDAKPTKGKRTSDLEKQIVVLKSKSQLKKLLLARKAPSLAAATLIALAFNRLSNIR